MGLPDVGLGHVRKEGHRAGGHEEELAPPYRGQRVVLGSQAKGPQQGASDGATSGAHELNLAEGANVGDDAGATIRVDGGPGHDTLPDSALDGERMSTGERLAVAFNYWFAIAWSNAKKRIKSPGGLYHAQPESLAQHDERIARHEWVPEGYEGKWLTHFGVAYHQTFGKFGKSSGYAWAWFWDTPLVFIPSVLGLFITVIWIRFF